MQCRICGNDTTKQFEAKVLSKYNVGYHLCSRCGYLQTDTPFWLEEAYSSPINNSDTGLLSRNLHLAEVTAAVYGFIFGGKGKLIDYAGGFGILTRLLRDKGLDAYWEDPYTQNLVALGFEAGPKDGPFKLLTSFECFEHLDKPIESFERMLLFSKNILFSTVLHPEPLPKPGTWWYYAFEHGQHVGIFSEKSLEALASKYGLNYYGMGSVHLITEQKIPTWKFKIAVKFAPLIWKWFFKSSYQSLTLKDSEKMKKYTLQ